MAKHRLIPDRPDWSALRSAPANPRDLLPPDLRGPDLDYWYSVGYAFGLASEAQKQAAGLPRYWAHSPETFAFIEGKGDRVSGAAPRIPVDVSFFRTVPVIPSGSATGGTQGSEKGV